MPTDHGAKLVSVVVPCFNESENLPELWSRLQRVWAAHPQFEFELIIVDDGSTDDTKRVVGSFHAADSRVRLLTLSRNFGHQAALTAGLDHARGAAVICMDADLQHPPEVIAELLMQWQAGSQVVNTIRLSDRRLSFFKRAGTALFYTVVNLLSDTPIEANAADFRLLDRRAVDALKQFPERARFLRGIVSWIGFRRSSAQFTPDQRFSGVTKFTWRKMSQLARDGILSFSTVPLRFVAWLGVFACLAGALEVCDALYVRIVAHTAVPGWTSLLIAVLFLGGAQMLALGIIGSYLGNVYDEARRRPIYLIADSTDESAENSQAPSA